MICICNILTWYFFLLCNKIHHFAFYRSGSYLYFSTKGKEIWRKYLSRYWKKEIVTLSPKGYLKAVTGLKEVQETKQNRTNNNNHKWKKAHNEYLVSKEVLFHWVIIITSGNGKVNQEMSHTPIIDDNKPGMFMQMEYILHIKEKYLNLLKFSQRSTQLINRIKNFFVLWYSFFNILLSFFKTWKGKIT